jgi:hypothetical protein
MFDPPGRRQLKRAVRGGVQWRPAPSPAPSRPPVYFYAVVMLGLAGLLALLGGLFVVTRAAVLGASLLAFAALCGVALWQLLRHTIVGYWLAVGVLFVAGVTPIIAFLMTGSGIGGVIFCPPAIVAGVMLSPRVRTSIIKDR